MQLSKHHIIALVSAVLLCGCSTERDLLELRRDRLLQIEANAIQVRNAIPQGSFDPARYDVYLAIDADVFQRAFAEIEGTKLLVEAKGRPIAIEIGTFATKFRPGSPEISLAASAVDIKSGLRAAIALDTRLILVGDPQQPDQLTAKLVATRVVPDLRWGPLNFTRGRFARAILALEATKLTDQIPSMRLPLAKDFSFGSSAQTLDSGTIPTGNDSWIRGEISIPDTRTSGQFAVKNILFLENGVHLFASVEGI